jgi:hypothetical protein
MIYETYNDSVNRYNVSAQSDPTIILSKSLNDSQIVIMAQAENNFLHLFHKIYFKRITSLTDYYSIHLAKSLLHRAY